MTLDPRTTTDSRHSSDRRNVLKLGTLTAGAAAIGLSPARAQTKGTPDGSLGASPLPNGTLRKGTFAYTLAHEQFRVPDLVRFGALASRSGFHVLATSDHFQPWQSNEGHSGAAWVTIGALGAQSPQSMMGTAVTCPTLRYNPAVVAEAFSTMSHLIRTRLPRRWIGRGPERAGGNGKLAKVAGALGPSDRGHHRHQSAVVWRTGLARGPLLYSQR